MDRKWRALALVATAELLAMSLWFSASAVAPELTSRWALTGTEAALLTSAVQIGFVLGALTSAATTLSDVVPARYLFAASALVGALCTAGVAVLDAFLPALGLRVLTGVALAGVYPPGMKLAAGWFDGGRGLAIGSVVGALTVGSALPHLLRGAGGVGDPFAVLYGAAGLAVVGALLVTRVRPGPYQAPTAPFDPRALGRVLQDQPTLLADLGYFGHMWELYAVWTWVPVYVLAATGDAVLAAFVAFGAIAAGGIGSLAAGALADRLGRTAVTSGSMIASGSACLLAVPAFGAPVPLLVAFLLVWGVVIVADSAQFSACVTELAEPGYVGSALTIQTAVGFLLTIGSIQVTPVVAEAVGWRWAFAPLAVGPLVGTLAMLRLRGLPAATQLASGRR